MKSPGISNSGKWLHPRPDEESGGGKTCRPEASQGAHRATGECGPQSPPHLPASPRGLIPAVSQRAEVPR